MADFHAMPAKDIQAIIEYLLYMGSQKNAALLVHRSVEPLAHRSAFV
jgi:hypothetical protein